MQVPPWRAGAFVRRLRLERGLTQRQLAQIAGESFDEREISQLERGMFGGMRPDRLQRLLEILQSDLMALYRWSLLVDEMTPIAPDWQVDYPLRIGTSEESDALSDLVRARLRLRDAIDASEQTCRRSSELLVASQQMLDGQFGATQSSGDLLRHC